MEVRGKMKQEQEPEWLGCCCQQSLTTHLYRESFFFLAFFGCSQPYAGHSGLFEGVEFSFPPRGALQSISLFPKHPSCPPPSCPVPAPHPRPPSGLLCLPAVPSRGHVPACPQSSPGHRSIFLGQNQSCPQGHPCSGNPGHPSHCPSSSFHLGAGWQLGVTWWAGTRGQRGRLRRGAVVSPPVIWRGKRPCPSPPAQRGSLGDARSPAGEGWRSPGKVSAGSGCHGAGSHHGALRPPGTGRIRDPKKLPVFPVSSFWPPALQPGLCRGFTATGWLHSAECRAAGVCPSRDVRAVPPFWMSPALSPSRGRGAEPRVQTVPSSR